MLSRVNNATEHRTLVLARQEMMSWTQLQLEPSALRAPDGFTSPHTIASNGAHLPATLYHLAQQAEQARQYGAEDIYTQVANRLAELVENVASIGIEVDEKRQVVNIVMTDKQGTPHLASALSDGTLRFMALTVMESDPSPRALICLEEPENGMHPQRIPAMIRLLQDLAVDTDEPVGVDNPFRQVIINTHSPSVVAEVPDDSLLLAEPTPKIVGGERIHSLSLLPLPNTWRSKLDPAMRTVQKGHLLAYLNPIQGSHDGLSHNGDLTSNAPRAAPRRRVKDRDDLQMLLPGLASD